MYPIPPHRAIDLQIYLSIYPSMYICMYLCVNECGALPGLPDRLPVYPAPPRRPLP